MAFTIQSSAFDPNARIPAQYTGEGADSSPPLSWSGVPEGTREFALICDDPDAPRPAPWVHWVMYKIPADTAQLPAGLPTAEQLDQPTGALQGQNSWDNIGYGGPMPPPGHGVHRYYFKLYALDKKLDLPPALEKEDLLDKLEGHILKQTQLVGTYERAS